MSGAHWLSARWTAASRNMVAKAMFLGLDLDTC